MPIQTITAAHLLPQPAAALSAGSLKYGPAKNGSAKDSPAKLRQAATDFEAMLLGQMLKSAREASGGGLTGDGDDDANSSLLDLGEQQFAQAMASTGALGIAKMVLAGLTNHADR
jgi:Rod binding domain-containing protein